MPRRALIHIGFHKTGTSSAERTLLANKDTLSEHFVVGRKTWPEVSNAAKAYSVDPRPMARSHLRDTLSERLRHISLAQRNLLISNVDLCGVLPGRDGVTDYAAVPEIAETIAQSMNDIWPDVQTTFLLTQRNQAAWQRSLYWQNLKVGRVRLDYDAFVDELNGTPQLNVVAQHVSQAIGDVDLKTRQLEDASHQLGPASLILEAAAVDKTQSADLTITPPRKIAPSPDIQALFLEINRSELSDEEVLAAKQDTLALLAVADK